MKTNKVNNISFTNAGNIGTGLKVASKIIGIQEGGAGLSNIRFRRKHIFRIIRISSCILFPDNFGRRNL